MRIRVSEDEFGNHRVQDIGLPYMCDSRHSPDSFFFVFEADFRFYQEDCLNPEEWFGAAAQQKYDSEAFFEEKEGKVLGEQVEPCADGSPQSKRKKTRSKGTGSSMWTPHKCCRAFRRPHSIFRGMGSTP